MVPTISIDGLQIVYMVFYSYIVNSCFEEELLPTSILYSQKDVLPPKWGGFAVVGLEHKLGPVDVFQHSFSVSTYLNTFIYQAANLQLSELSLHFVSCL